MQQQRCWLVHKHRNRVCNTANTQACPPSFDLSGDAHELICRRISRCLINCFCLDVRVDAVQCSRPNDIRGNPAGNGHTREGLDSGASVIVDGQVAATFASANTKDKGNRTVQRVHRQRWFLLQAAQVSC